MIRKADKQKKKVSSVKVKVPGKKRVVVGIGASAGGLEALRVLFNHLDCDTGMTFVIIQHLSPSHESLLSTILARNTAMPVMEVKDKTLIKPNYVYIIPPGSNMTLREGVLHLSPRREGTRVQLPIDLFFTSLAKEQKHDAVAVVLSGTGSDGGEGAKIVKAEGGISMAQSPDSARFNAMPSNAIFVDHIDFVLSAEEIGKELSKIGKMLKKATSRPSEDFQSETQVHIQLDKILLLLKQTIGTDFSQYKLTTIRRRVLRRMLLHKIDSLTNYFRLLQQDISERKSLGEDVLINVTQFFREPESFQCLKKKVLPELFRKKEANYPIRVWIPGCSSGEEVYSIAMSLVESLGGDLQKALGQVQIFGTDLSESCLERARQGNYLETISLQVPPPLLKKYFHKTESGYRTSKAIRDLCVFAKHDLTRDPPFSKLDLISCRNVMIYFGQDLQTKILSSFHYSLNPGGFLLLGESETIGVATDLFTKVDSKCKIYSKKSVFGSRFPSHPWPLPPRSHNIIQIRKNVRSISASMTEIQIETDRAILARYSPSAVVIDTNYEILHFRGDTEPFLSHKGGEASLNFFKMLGDGLRTEFKEAIKTAQKKDLPVSKKQVPFGLTGILNFEVIPLKFLPGERCFLIIFEKEEHPEIQRSKSQTVSNKAIAVPKKGIKERELIQLRQELSDTKDHLQSLIYDLERANQDLQSANEEVVSSNEELQSTNEELETSKEELQSTNEELSTVNDELHSRNQDLFALNNDLINVLNSVYVPVIIVGNDLCIRRFTPMASKMLNVIPSDIGRPLTDITSNLFDVEKLRQVILEVIETATLHESEIQDKEGRWYILRVRPYKTLDQKLEGGVVTLTDVNQFKLSTDKKQF